MRQNNKKTLAIFFSSAHDMMKLRHAGCRFWRQVRAGFSSLYAPAVFCPKAADDGNNN
ncbi:MAG: hypothetical protein ACR2P4_03850 [Gammaproteobacteria bacterium]